MSTGLHAGNIEFPEVSAKLVKPTEPAVARVAGNEICTYGKSNAWVRNISLDISGTALERSFSVGQAFGVIPPGRDTHGKPHKVRLYSIASPEDGEDGAGKVVCTPVKRVVDEYRNSSAAQPTRRGLFLGVCSNYLCDLVPGDEVLVTGPIGKRFLLPIDREAHDYVFVATGTGIAPFRGMLLELLRSSRGPTQRQIWLLMGAPYTSDLLYHEQLLQLQREFDNFNYVCAISREPHAESQRGIYVDRLFQLQRERLAPLLAAPHTLLYLCGLAGMQFGVFRQLRSLGLLNGYATPTAALCARSVADWSDQAMRHAVKPNERCMLEVY
jgi:ferredoxin--NADP+ reductase